MGCADVCVSMDYDGSNAFYSEATRRARKPHRCAECNEPIDAGELYHYAAGKSNGDFFAQHTCSACAEIRQEVSCGSWVFGELWESIREQLFPYWHELKTIDCLARLTEPALAKMQAEYTQFKEDQDG